MLRAASSTAFLVPSLSRNQGNRHMSLFQQPAIA
jgi:hypothetical protein